MATTLSLVTAAGTVNTNARSATANKLGPKSGGVSVRNRDLNASSEIATAAIKGRRNNFHRSVVSTASLAPAVTLPNTSLSSSDVPPLIDLHGLVNGTSCDPSVRAAVVKQLHDSARDFGVLRLINHGIDTSVLAGLRRAAKDFFEMSTEEKDECSSVRDSLFRPVGFKRQFHDETGRSPVVVRREVFEFQVYPLHCRADTPWPVAVPAFKEYIVAYSDGLEKLAKWTLGALSEGLGLDTNAMFEQVENPEGGAFHQKMVVAHYPPLPVLSDSDRMGFSPHSDLALCNILIQDDAGGFQILKDGAWLDVPPVMDSVLFTVGDPMETISNGRYHAVVHRVLNQPTRFRFSCITTVEPYTDNVVFSPSPGLQGPMNYVPWNYYERLSQLLTSSKGDSSFDPEVLTKKFMVIDPSVINESCNFAYKNNKLHLGGLPFSHKQ